MHHQHQQLVDSIRECIFEQDIDLMDNMILPILRSSSSSERRVKLSEILGASHALCDNCCSLYTPCHVGEWIATNQELYDSEICIFADLIDRGKEYIDFDVVPYTDEEINTYSTVSSVNRKDRIRQIYTVISKLY